MGDRDDGPLEVLQGPGEDVDGGGIQVVAGLVQEQEVARHKRKCCKRHPRLLASAKNA